MFGFSSLFNKVISLLAAIKIITHAFMDLWEGKMDFMPKMNFTHEILLFSQATVRIIAVINHTHRWSVNMTETVGVC